MSEMMDDAIRKQIVVDAPLERAFRVFTSRFDAWWPREHHILQAPLAKAVLEPHAGGRWYEVATDGSECEWGKVLVWEPPRRLVLAWQIDASWQYDASLVTELELRFIPQGQFQTRVELEHRNLDRLGANAAAARQSLSSPQGWGGLLQLYAMETAKESSHA